MLYFLLFWMERTSRKKIQLLHFWVNKADVFQEVADFHQNNHCQKRKKTTSQLLLSNVAQKDIATKISPHL